MGNKPVKPAKPAKEELLLKIVPPVDRAYVRYLSRDLERIHGFTPKYPRAVKPPDHYIEYMQLHGWLDLDLDDPDLARLFKYAAASGQFIKFPKLELYGSPNVPPIQINENRHILRQLQSGWADGPAYVTPSVPFELAKVMFKTPIVGQGGTLWWHAHFSWLGASIYGPITVLPKHDVSYENNNQKNLSQKGELTHTFDLALITVLNVPLLHYKSV